MNFRRSAVLVDSQKQGTQGTRCQGGYFMQGKTKGSKGTMKFLCAFACLCISLREIKSYISRFPIVQHLIILRFDSDLLILQT